MKGGRNNMYKSIYQLKITLKGIEPLIWRRIQVPDNYRFWDLHVAIQDSMGWTDSHLHVFRIKRKHARSVTEIGIPSEEKYEGMPEIIPGWEVPLSHYFFEPGTICEYEYDFGDTWIHEILLEGRLIREKGEKYPKCIGGQRACPPEDVGGDGGYYDMLEALSNPGDEEYEEYVNWLGGIYDPDAFSAVQVKFDNPKKRLRNLSLVS